MYILHRHLRLLRRTLGFSIAALLILSAVILGVANEVLPLAERHPAKVARWLSERAGRTVAFDRVRTEWTRRGPLLQLDNLRIGDGPRPLVIGDTEMLVSLYAGVLPGQALTELRLRGLDLTLEHLADGRWQVRGLPGQQQPGTDPLAALEGLGELQVIGGRLTVSAPAFGIQTRIPRIDVRLRVDEDRVRSGVRAWPQAGGTPVDVVLDLQRGNGTGLAYATARHVKLGDWSSLLHLAGVRVQSGEGDARAWSRLRGYRIEQVQVESRLRNVVLLGAPLSGERTRSRFEQLEATARWRPVAGGWRVEAPRLRVGSGAGVQTLDGLVIGGGREVVLRAAELDAAPLIALATLSDRLPTELRHWLRAAQPTLRLHAVDVAGRTGDASRIRARISGLGFRPVRGAPGMHGVAGTLQGDTQAFSLQLQDRHAARIDWPLAFGVPHAVKLRGDLVGWRDGAGWRMATPALRIAGDGFAVSTRGGLHWSGDGSRPVIDLAARVEEGSVPVAKRFWIQHVMPVSLVQWLDNALLAGRIEEGRVVVSGDLDDWPFARRNGRFEAAAHIADATLKFQPDWPAAEDLDADVRFLGDGFGVTGRARLGTVAVQRLEGGIDHYAGGRLVVHASSRTDARALLALLRRGPLEKTHRETFAALGASGPATATFELAMPMQKTAPTRIGGTLALHGAQLSDRRWSLDFTRVRGTARYSGSGFDAENLQVHHDNAPGRLALRAGAGHVRNAGNVFEASLDAVIRADDLIDRAPAELAWLKPRLDGRSNWSVGIMIPRAAGNVASPTVLQLRSDLVGTALELPAPLAKMPAAALATIVETPLPLGSGDVRIAFGQVAAIRARSGQGRSGVRVVLGAGQVNEAPPRHGLIATGRAAEIDAIEWIALAHGGTGTGAGSGLPLQRIDVTAQRLNLLGGRFPDARIVVAPSTAGATAVRVEGAALEGALVIPDAKGATVSGRFARLHWRLADADAGAVPKPSTMKASPATASAMTSPRAGISVANPANGFNPADIPSLAFDIDDLRIGEARLGTARLRTRSTPAGMQVEQLQARSTHQQLDMTGEWTGRAAGARTRFDATLGSDDFGALMAGLGYGGQLGGGKGHLQLQAEWPGSPADFQLGTMAGSLKLDARNGRLLEIEPGAGRVLGLLSLAELPRRLTLDFRDFFSKGFSFNRMGGTVRFADGSARSDDLRIDGPAAGIEIRGTANLRAQRFDQTIEVRPKAGNLLTAVGALAGGPVGAALGAAANAVLRKPLGQLGARTYRVTGPWRDPKVEVVGREPGRAPDVARSAPSG